MSPQQQWDDIHELHSGGLCSPCIHREHNLFWRAASQLWQHGFRLLFCAYGCCENNKWKLFPFYWSRGRNLRHIKNKINQLKNHFIYTHTYTYMCVCCLCVTLDHSDLYCSVPPGVRRKYVFHFGVNWPSKGFCLRFWSSLTFYVWITVWRVCVCVCACVCVCVCVCVTENTHSLC